MQDIETRIKTHQWHPTLAQYYRAGAWTAKSPHFEPEEVYSPQAIRKYPHLIDFEFLSRLNKYRIQVGETLTLNTYLWQGYQGRSYACLRTSWENRGLVGSATESMHLRGKAGDLMSKTLTPIEIFTTAYESGFFSGLGLYDTFVHVDTRARLNGIATWDNRVSTNRTEIRIGGEVIFPR